MMSKENQLSDEKFRARIMEFEEKFSMCENVRTGDDLEKICPVKHYHVPGAYIREIFMPSGILLTSKIHKKQHPFFVMLGDCSVITDSGIERIVAPHFGITEPGTKRLLYMHKDTIWITVHPTELTDINDIEEEIIAKSFAEIDFDRHEPLTEGKQ